jgi:predicted PurR-regulated permease PerM
MRKFLSQFIFTRTFVEHTISFLGIACIVFIGKDFLVFFLTAFLCASLFGSSSSFIHHFLAKNHHKIPKTLRPLIAKITSEKGLIFVLYTVFAFICVYTISDIWPTLIADMAKLLQEFSQKFGVDIGMSGIQNTLWQWQNLSTQISDFINVISPTTDTKQIVAQLIHIGGIFFQVILGYIVSLIWLLENETVKKYFSKLKQGPFAFFYHDFDRIFHKITHSFWLVFYAQFKIAIVNTILTVIGLVLIGFFYGQITLEWSATFPYLLALWFITFLTSFVPILGVFISGIPILFAGIVEYPGWSIVVVILSMLTIIHIIEWYFLNPRIVGHSLNIPAPIIFIILFVSEHFMGLAGFFLWVPLYILALEVIESVGRIVTQQYSENKSL